MSRLLRTELRWARETVTVCGVDADGAHIVVLEVLEVRVISPGHAGNASSGTNEAWTDVDCVGITGFHVNGGERWERTRLGLVVVRCLCIRTAAWVVALEEERAWAIIREGRCLQL